MSTPNNAVTKDELSTWSDIAIKARLNSHRKAYDAIASFGGQISGHHVDLILEEKALCEAELERRGFDSTGIFQSSSAVAASVPPEEREGAMRSTIRQGASLGMLYASRFSEDIPPKIDFHQRQFPTNPFIVGKRVRYQDAQYPKHDLNGRVGVVQQSYTQGCDILFDGEPHPLSIHLSNIQSENGTEHDPQGFGVDLATGLARLDALSYDHAIDNAVGICRSIGGAHNITPVSEFADDPALQAAYRMGYAKAAEDLSKGIDFQRTVKKPTYDNL